MSEREGGAEPPVPPSRPAAAPWEPPFPPAPRPQRNWIVPVAVLGFVVLVVIVGVILLESALAGLRDSYSSASEPPRYTRAPTPTPTTFSTTCASGCLTVDSARALIPNASLQKALDADTDVIDGALKPPTTAALEHHRDVAAWTREPATEPDCFFMGSRSPVAVTPDSADAQSLDPVSLLPTSDILGGGTTMTQTARFFTTPEAATQYEQQVQAQAALCHARNPRMGPAEALDTPPSVASNAFADPEDRTTTYVYDFRRANAVVRFRVVTSAGVNENTVRTILSIWAADDLAQVALN